MPGLLYLLTVIAALVTSPTIQRRLQQTGPMPAGLDSEGSSSAASCSTGATRDAGRVRQQHGAPEPTAAENRLPPRVRRWGQ